MRVVYEYALKVGRNDLDLPPASEILTVQLQDGTPHVWVLLNPDLTPRIRRVLIVTGTGFQIEYGIKKYIGTVQMDWLVWHVFEVHRPATEVI